MTISHAAPHWPPNALAPGDGGAAPALLVSVENSVDFVIGPEVPSVAAMERADTVASLALPRMLEDVPDAARICAEVQAVLIELVDVTARYRADGPLVGRIAHDAGHITVSVGDMARVLPAPEEEPGLYLVHRLASEIGQYEGDHGGRVTWAAVPCSH
ncbi:hypothetical protein SEA_GILGAMESH_97 [Streptomyces phage Gilgamesh]|uniref:Uncharacterized protein n=1 Tax=Streptomyces phage Gilgamesh TaxID=2599890 RepID=A0A5J6TTT9_9CAUD|nr:hypothetical protein QEH35_gp097 [Streptomyces phage Gilgamesh]QFG13289.1 hypothetical protein SEA_GILGAMESH_97 [Streptomyces phage Gilgamesh]